MPVFEPPTTDGVLVGAESDPGWTLWRHYGAWEMGQTVWKDQAGVWHTQTFPYQGGSTSTTHDGDTTTITAPDEGLATAQKVYLGGHRYDISEADAAELVAAGFKIGGHWPTEEQRWIDFALASANNLEWKGGDGCASLYNASQDVSSWTFADNLIGTINADGFYNFALPTHNALLTRSAAGVIVQPKPEGSHPAWTHPDPNKWWWPLDLTYNALTETDTVVLAMEVQAGGSYGQVTTNSLLSLNAFGGRTGTVDIAADVNVFQGHTLWNDADGFIYIVGHEFETHSDPDYLLSLSIWTRIARVPIGQLTTTAWTWWTGTGWSASLDDAVKITDQHGNPIQGSCTVTKVGSTYVLLAMGTESETMRLYRSTAVTGPWTFYRQAVHPNPPQAGTVPPNNKDYAYYQPKFHEWMNPSAGVMVATYNRNPVVRPGVVDAGDPIHVSTFCPQFVYLPAP